jgi:hypothetical protein
MDALAPRLIEDAAREADACRDLWHDALKLCWTDFTGRTTCTSAEHKEATAFMTAMAGEWAEARAMVCSLAGLDPDALREAALRHQRGDD